MGLFGTTLTTCTCTTRACAYKKKKQGDVEIPQQGGEDENALLQQVSNMIVKFFDPHSLDAPDLVVDDDAFNKLINKINDVKIPVHLQIPSDCVGFCDVVPDLCTKAKKETFKEGYKPKCPTMVIVCIVLAIAIVAFALLLWYAYRKVKANRKDQQRYKAVEPQYIEEPSYNY